MARVSSSSRSGIESATMPAPARNSMSSPRRVSVRIRMLKSASPSVPSQPERAGVGAPPLAFERRDDLHAAHLRAPGDRAARKQRAQRVHRRAIGAQPAAHVGDDVMHVRIGLGDHVFVHRHAARLADAAEIVALEVDQHDVFGALLRMRHEFGGIAPILLGDAVARARAGDGPRRDLAARDAQQPFGRRRKDRPCRSIARWRRTAPGWRGASARTPARHRRDRAAVSRQRRERFAW